jgi:hypothetical protein
MRPVAVISDACSLENRALVIELSSHRINENSIFWFSYHSKKTNNMRDN